MNNISESTFYRILDAEKKEIDRLKWYESEKAGCDIGSDHAWFLWTVRHKSRWYSGVYRSGVENFLKKS